MKSAYNPKQIVLANFPFTDSTEEHKRRPCLLIAKCKGFYWALFVTSVDSRQQYDEFTYQISNGETTAPLPNTSCIRCNILMTIHPSQIIKLMTTMHDEPYERVRDICKTIFDTGTFQ